MAVAGVEIQTATATLAHVDREAWDREVVRFDDYNYRQASAYVEAIAARRHARFEYAAIRSGDQTAGLAAVRIHYLPGLRKGIAYISGGPLFRRSGQDDASSLGPAIEALYRSYVVDRGLVLRVAPAAYPPDLNPVLTRTYEEFEFVPHEHGRKYRTLMCDIGGQDSAVRKRLDQKWRNCLNNSEKHGLVFDSGAGASRFSRFGELLDRLKQAKGFSVDLDAPFYANVESRSRIANEFVVAFATHGEELHAGGVFAFQGGCCTYLLGATAEAGKKTRASYFLHWSIILEAKRRGLTWYDLGGIDPEANPGVYEFKRGLGALDVTAPGPFQALPRGVMARLPLVGERLVRVAKRWRGRRG